MEFGKKIRAEYQIQHDQHTGEFRHRVLVWYVGCVRLGCKLDDEREPKDLLHPAAGRAAERGGLGTLRFSAKVSPTREPLALVELLPTRHGAHAHHGRRGSLQRCRRPW